MLAIMVLVAGCAGGGEAARDRAYHLAQQAGFSGIVIAAGSFHLMAFVRLSRPSSILRVYFEGDGHAWQTMQQPSDDPTPWSPISLGLAAADPAPSVAYLARPCQYVPRGTDAACTPAAWTSARYSTAVIASINEGLDRLKRRAGAMQLELVGFSGGGAVAVLAAAGRSDVRNLRTVAANLDTALWTSEHGVSPLTGSLNPVEQAPRLASLAQMHFVGGGDRIVDAAVVRSYAAAAGPSRCISVEVVPGMEHDGDWPAVWPGLLSRPLPTGCRGTTGAAIR